ncbi:MAG: ATP-dependent DNA helicase RecG [Candidatus Bipolaricaulota bacterium]
MNKNKILKILELERQKEFSNDAVLGGLEEFIENNCEKQKVRQTVQGYAEKNLLERKECINELENLLQSDSPISSSGSEESLQPTDPIEKATGVGTKRGELLRDLGLETVEDLFFYFPRKLEDRREIRPISDLKPGIECTVTGKVQTVQLIRPKKGVELVKVALQDDSQEKLFAIWFNQPWLKKQFEKGHKLAVFGEIERHYGELQIENPIWEPAERKEKTRQLVPIYSGTEDLKQSTIRWIIGENLPQYLQAVTEYVPGELLTREELFSRREAFWFIHNPEGEKQFEKARKSLAFAELYLFHLGITNQKWEERGQGFALEVDREQLQSFKDKLPYDLTEDQEKAIMEVVRDLEAEEPMERLLQGDVGVGKTVVAAAAIFLAAQDGSQAALMAPTTVLARQHFRTLSELFSELPLEVLSLSGNTDGEERKDALKKLGQGAAGAVVGTHALLEDEVDFSDLKLVVIDEEQRFGVAQRARLKYKDQFVNALVMSATPIPRTFTATLYGQYAVSKLEERPWGERCIDTYWVDEAYREEVYEFLKDKLAEGGKAFIVVPRVEESEEAGLKSAEALLKELERNRLKQFNLDLLHGRMPRSEKERVLQDFSRGTTEAIVSTTVIEVGIDIPEADLLVIEQADQFGLTQLHQMRGRIGRKGQQAYCVAIASPTTDNGRRRLEAFRDILDGFELVEEDLRIRGPGDLLGAQQHGFENSFRACDLLKDLDIVSSARKAALDKLEQGRPGEEILAEFERIFGKNLKWIGS